jgi:hypothetical protein
MASKRFICEEILLITVSFGEEKLLAADANAAR